MVHFAVPPESLRRISRVEYETMVEAGLFADERVELLYGSIVTMSPKGTKHEATIQRLTARLVVALSERAAVRIQSSFAASDGSEPEPDVAVVPRGDYDDHHPTEANLLIEVAESSLATDRGPKAQLYAECGVPEYWVVNLIDNMIEVHTDIIRGVYTSVTPCRPGQTVAPRAFPDVAIAVREILPKS
jgi:Uma2 family endonuclease